MRFILTWLFSIALAASVQAAPRGKFISPTGRASLNLGAGDITSQSYTNLWWITSISFAGTNSPAALDQYAFPVRNFSGIITYNLGSTFSTTGPWTWSWDAGRSCFNVTFLKVGTATNIPAGVTVTNNGSGNLTVQGNCGTAGSITINWADTGGTVAQFNGTYTSWNLNTTGRFAMVRNSDLAAYNAGIYWTPEMVYLIGSLHPESLRLMGVNVLNFNIWTNVANFQYRKTTSSITFSDVSYPPGTRCGGGANFCTMAVASGQVTSAAADDTSLAGWVDGEQIMGSLAANVPSMAISGVVSNGGNCQYTVASTANLSAGMPIYVTFINGATECNSQVPTTILTVDSATQFTANLPKGASTYTNGGYVGYQKLTITGKAGGAKLIANFTGTPIGSTFDSLSSGTVTFNYNAVLDKVIAVNSGIGNAPPLEAQVQLANLVGANFWYNFPTFATNAYVTSAANLIYANLNPSLKGIFEYSNECWNFGQGCAQYAVQMGWVLGLTTNAAGPYTSLRVRQIHGLVSASNWSAALSRLERVYCDQAVGNPVGNMNGSALVSPGNAAYQAYVGGAAVNYNTSPNRPIDFTDTICYAPYVGGGAALSGQSPDMGNFAPSTNDAATLNQIVASTNAGNNNAASSLIDQLIRGDLGSRVQTVTATGTTFTTPLAHNFSVNDNVRFTVAGGTTYSGLDTRVTYSVLSTPTTTTFTAGAVTAGSVGAAVNAGTAGSGTTSVSDLANGQQLNIFASMSWEYTKWQGYSISGFSPVPAPGNPNVRWYEGALEPTAPSTAQCTAISINSTDCGTLATAVTNWKSSAYAAPTQLYYFQAFTGAAAGTITTGAMSKSTAPSNLVLQGGSLYAYNANSSYVAPSLYQMYYGFQQFGP